MTDTKQWLRPSEIADRGLITNTKGNPDYRFIVRLINNGLLKSKVYTTTRNGDKYHLVHVDEIKRYNEEGL